MIEGIRQIRTIDDLLDFPIAQEIEKGIALYQKLQENLYALASSDEDRRLTSIKVGTVLTLAVLRKISAGIKPEQFTSDDWAEIANSVSEYAVLKDGKDYTTFVFGLYADYIQWSASLYEGKLDPQKIKEIADLSDELRRKTVQLKEGRILETEYVEECLWICLEAIVKLLSSLVYLSGIPGLGDAAQAAAMLCYEYGRLALYSKEQALLTEYIQNQYHLDAELQEKFNAFKAELDSDATTFTALIDKAFDPSFRESLMASAELAVAAGVHEEEVLKTKEDVDSFFID